ncbi:MAG: tRNA (adenosine(37)-N6)-threonylcarbamoyltransferase complex ATPase subunit type 1 TsaE [Candidatus Marinimicrobia bacterium]|nr:tRNA (adenosine(37)-N6)-threonylcarbamoyltransferase complex ATPase subunit type 1 TsaE [Candidatus Neomarinimicrobiota bacterium]
MNKEKFTFESKSAEATIAFGKQIAARLKPNDVLALYGDLASGKTTFVKGVNLFYHADQTATSPTFTLINEYRGDIPIFHIDCYRLRHPDEIIMLGFEDYLNAGGVVLIEWPERIEAHIPPELYGAPYETYRKAQEADRCVYTGKTEC